MTPIKFNIRTVIHQHPLISGLTNIAGEPDISFDVLNSRPAPGIASSELLINIAISIGTGVPTGIAANWIFAKLGLGKDTRLYDQTGELIASVKLLEEKLNALSESQKTDR